MNEREWDKRLRIRTIGREDESDPNYSPYEPTPYPVLERLADSGHLTRKHHLLDYGCGKGRAAFFLASAVGCRVTGIDHSQKLIDLARENRRACRAGDRVRLIRALAEQYDPGEENAFFFFNPFGEKVFEAVLRRLQAAHAEAPRPMTLLCYFPSEEYMRCLGAAPGFAPVDAIDCRDLFGGKNERERIEVWRYDGA